MARKGFITQVKGNIAVVASTKRGICAECADKGSCGLEDGHNSDLPEEVNALNPIGAKAGDWVEFDLPGHAELRLSFIIWVVPLIGLIAGAGLAESLLGSTGLSGDALAAIGGVVGCALSFIPVVAYDRRMAKGKGVQPVITKVVKPFCSTGS